MASSEATAVRVRRVIEAPRYRVFRAWTDPDEVVNWWPPPGYTTPGVAMDLTLGGAFRYGLVTPDDRQIAAVGTFAQVDGAARLVMSWRWQGTELDDEETTLTVQFHDHGDSTEIDLSHAGFTDPEAAAEIEEGWTECLARLAESLSAAP